MPDIEKFSIHEHEKFTSTNFGVEETSTAGHVATDEKGNALFDVDLEAEARLRRKIDWHVLPPIMLLYLWCFIDRANIGNANIAGMPKDLNLSGYQYNLLLTAFFIPYVLFEIPMVMLLKKYGPGRALPIACFFFGLFAFLTAFVTNFTTAFVVRFLVGWAECCVLPGIAFYLTRWYRKSELVFRLSCYIVCAPISGAFGGLFASAILLLPGFGTITTWRMIFFIEGLITMVVGSICWFLITDRPDSAKWLTKEEKALAIARVKSENVGQTVVIDSIKKKALWQGITAPTTLSLALLFLFNNITVQGLGFFLPTIIKAIYPTKTTIELQLQTVPPYIVGAFFTLLFPYLSWRTNKRGIYMLICSPLIMTGYIMFVCSSSTTVRFAATFLIAAGAFSFGALTNAWVSINCTSDTSRAAAISTAVCGGNLGGLIATWSYLPYMAPSYLPGHYLNLASAASIFTIAASLMYWMNSQNKAKAEGKHDYRLEGLNAEEVEALGPNHPGFKYRL